MNASDASAAIEGAQASDGTAQFLTFMVGQEEYGLDLIQVREVKGWTPTTPLPSMPEYMRGVLNLRGVIVPVFDLRARFGDKLTDATEKHVVIIFALQDKLVGLLVDSVSDILTVDEADIKPAPKTSTLVEKQYLSGLIPQEKNMVVILDVSRLVDQGLVEQAVAQG